MKQYDIVAIGDIAVDIFIALQDAHTNCDIDNNNCTITMKWGDKIPFKQATTVYAVGNSPNASVSAHRLGLASSVITRVGNDTLGTQCINALQQEGVHTELIEVIDNATTNTHYVLSYNAERTILVKHEDFNYSMSSLTTPPKALYLSSLSEHALSFHNDVVAYKQKHNDTLLVFQPGTFQIKAGLLKLKEVYAHSDIFFCNKEEAASILNTGVDDIPALLKDMHSKGPRIVVITNGPQGAYAFDGNEMLYMPMYPDPKPPVERTGAGDSFSSTFTSYIVEGKSLQDALVRAPINSMSVVQHIGAQKGLLHANDIETFLQNAPKEYTIKKI